MEKPTGSQSQTILNRKKAMVHVEIISDVNGGDFDMTVNGNDLPPVTKVKHKGKEVPMLTFENGYGGTWGDGYEITFKLKDSTKRGYGFFVDPNKNPPNPNDAMWVECITSKDICPKKQAQWSGFNATDIGKDRQTLVVENPNDQLQYFGFALHFSRDGEKQPTLTFDPIGEDRNGRLL